MAESEADVDVDVRRDADPGCRVCQGAGWHWGWELLSHGRQHIQTGDPIRLRCPCVDAARKELADAP